MTKAQANEIKKIINKDEAAPYTTYYQSKNEVLRVRVYTYNNDKYDSAKEKEEIIKLLNKLSANGMRPRYSIDHKTYQGFIHDTFVIFQ